jgi:hypothetical protein
MTLDEFTDPAPSCGRLAGDTEDAGLSLEALATELEQQAQAMHECLEG